MNRGWQILAGVMATVLASLAGLVLIPNWQLGDVKAIEDDYGNLHPHELFGAAALGRDVYIDLGCIYCHTQQVRRQGYGADIERGWGNRQTVARDYIFDRPHLLGTMRTGPDLANIGARQKNKTWHYLHLYNPQITSPGSIMPEFPFLFERIADSPSPLPGAILLPARSAGARVWILPNERATNLVAYLLSLDKSYDVPEAR